MQPIAFRYLLEDVTPMWSLWLLATVLYAFMIANIRHELRDDW